MGKTSSAESLNYAALLLVEAAEHLRCAKTHEPQGREWLAHMDMVHGYSMLALTSAVILGVVTQLEANERAVVIDRIKKAIKQGRSEEGGSPDDGIV